VAGRIGKSYFRVFRHIVVRFDRQILISTVSTFFSSILDYGDTIMAMLATHCVDIEVRRFFTGKCNVTNGSFGLVFTQ
jgi:hypothetical protein